VWSEETGETRDGRELIGVEHVEERGRRRSKLVNENSGPLGEVRPFEKIEERLQVE
jgi:hypothetical protein